VTTEVVGNCGWTYAPVTEHSRLLVEARMRTFAYEEPAEWSTFAEHLAFLSRTGHSPNLAWFVGHNTVRWAAGVHGTVATEEELRAMESHVEEAMDAGALGLSTGLEFNPGRDAPTEEIVRLNKVVGRYGGIYTSHVRNRDSHLQESIDEFLAIVRQGGTRGEISHLNVRHRTGASPGAWQRAVETMALARDEGLDVLADTTPFRDGLGQMAGILPPWVLADGWEAAWDAYFDILAAAGPAIESILLVGELFTDEHLAEMIVHPLFSLGVDGFTSAVGSPLTSVTAHPVCFAGHVHYLTRHVGALGTLPLEHAIRKMTSMPATHFGLRERGLVRDGFAADLVVIDLDRLEDGSTLADPLNYVRGVDHVVVNGTIVVDDGEHTGARPGRHLART
jgi:N-acyl-D-amino-acid deacylase